MHLLFFLCYHLCFYYLMCLFVCLRLLFLAGVRVPWADVKQTVLLKRNVAFIRLVAKYSISYCVTEGRSWWQISLIASPSVAGNLPIQWFNECVMYLWQPLFKEFYYVFFRKELSWFSCLAGTTSAASMISSWLNRCSDQVNSFIHPD